MRFCGWLFVLLILKRQGVSQNLTLVQELLYHRSHNIEAWVTLQMHQIFVSSMFVISGTVQTDFFSHKCKRCLLVQISSLIIVGRTLGLSKRGNLSCHSKTVVDHLVPHYAGKFQFWSFIFHISFSELFFRSLVFHNGFMIFLDTSEFSIVLFLYRAILILKF